MALAGDKLVGGEYKKINVKWHDSMRCSGYSEALDLYVCWEYGRLRWYDHHTGKYLLTFFDERDFRMQETARADQAEMRAELEAYARRQEAYAREEAESENRTLRAELERLRRGDR